MKPHPKTIPVPGVLPSTRGDQGLHEDFSSGGLYSTKELESWRWHIDIGTVHDVVMKKFTLGVCLHQQECSSNGDNSDLPRFDKGHLQNPLEWVSLGWKQKIEEFVQSNATFVSLLVLAIEGAHFSTFVFLLIQTAMLHGHQAAQAIAYTVLCGVCHKSKKIVRWNPLFTSDGVLERGKSNPLSQEAGTEAKLVNRV